MKKEELYVWYQTELNRLEEEREIYEREVALVEKHLHIRKETACCEEQYEEELRKFVEEEC